MRRDKEKISFTVFCCEQIASEECGQLASENVNTYTKRTVRTGRARFI